MPVDIVIDTNVMVHADNEQEPKQPHCLNLLNLVSGSTIELCIDDGFSLIEAQNTSHIGLEYLKHLRIGMTGYTLMLKLLSEDRIQFLPKKIPAAINKKINQTGIKKSDRIFVKIAYNSNDKILVTHDYVDFTDNIREIIDDEIDVKVIEAVAYCGENITAANNPHLA
jgi:predicted nucleic acid-binding protein